MPMIDIIGMFTKDKELNDEMVNNYVRKISTLETKVFDLKMLKEQIAVALIR